MLHPARSGLGTIVGPGGRLCAQILSLVGLLLVLARNKCTVERSALRPAAVDIGAVPDVAIEYGNGARFAQQVNMFGMVGQSVFYIVAQPAGLQVTARYDARRAVFRCKVIQHPHRIYDVIRTARDALLTRI